MVLALATRISNAETLSFNLEIDGGSTGELLTADGADIEIEALEFRDGNDPGLMTRLVPGTARFTPLVVTYNRDQNQAQKVFHQEVRDWVNDTRDPSLFRDFRRNISLVTLASDNSELERATLADAFPIFFSPITPELAGTERIYELHVVFDSARVEAVPEPSTALLMIIVGLVMMGFRSTRDGANRFTRERTRLTKLPR